VTAPDFQPPPIASDQDYAERLGDLPTWEPLARAALERARIPQPSRLEIAHPLGTYPALLADARPRLVIKLFGDRYAGPESHAAELAGYQVLDGHQLPVPRLVAAGELLPGHATWQWPFLILTELPGQSYATAVARLDPGRRATVARSIGALLRRLHELPLPQPPGPLASWDRFLALLRRRRLHAPADHRRWGLLPARLCDQLDGWLPDPDALVDTSRPPVFVHGDLHSDHVFVDAGGGLTGIIDFTDVYAADPRHDLVALHFGTFGLDTTLLSACLDAYGWDRRPATWAREMLAFTLLHDFNLLRPEMRLDQFPTLDQLAHSIWDLP
jgi:hygromycin-B 7''-O-kinase